MSDLYELEKHNVCIEEIWPLPNGHVPASMIEFMEELGELPGTLIETLGWAGDPFDLMETSEMLFEGPGGVALKAWQSLMGDLRLRGKSGFLVHLRRPRMKYGLDNSQSANWGIQTSYCLFSETIDGAIANAVALAKDLDALGYRQAQRAQA
jgi:hypothetical protein